MPIEESESEIGEVFEKAVKTICRYLQIVDGMVGAVDKTAFTCDVTVGDSFGTTTYHDVTLRVLKGSQASFIEIPKVGSACTIYWMDGNLGRPKMFMVDQTDELLVNCPQVTFNGGDLGGMVKLLDTVQRFNNIENLLNAFFDLFNLHTHNVTAVGSPSGPSLAQQGNKLTPTQRTDIENTAIKQ